ncbi:hypothetical protein PV08_01878 [Exophiala spinifera]|uniref:Uncharacterized protein n=1 Tax=Exophiala spinifera TaxID=91928 RepID=A0A0D2BQM8_9EURO|nr:uncharacterized protein PV08_01878 [Exophiala spinifera]KIW21298.1 hypothetical protein PV08_01878 [Exophiala spinifera]
MEPSPAPDNTPNINPAKNALAGPRSRPMSEGGSQSPALTNHQPRTSPLLGNKFESMFRPLSGSFEGKTPEVTHISASDDGCSPGPGNEKPHRFSQTVQDFPKQPKKLSMLPNLLYFILDISLTLMPLVFIVYGILAALLDGRPTGSYYFTFNGHNWSGDLYGPAMLKVQVYIPTFFLMAFGIEVARLVKIFALWRAQQGTHLGFLEQLMGSRSLSGTLSSMWGLRVINWMGVLLLIIWALGPLGSQAGARIISANGTDTNTAPLYYMNTDAIPDGLQSINNDLQYYTFAVNSLYSTSLLTPSSIAAPQDPWTNVKIPSLEYLEENRGCDEYGWCSVALARKHMKNNQSLVTAGTWTSLTGLPVVGGQFGVGVQNFTMSASYYVFDCESLNLINVNENFTSSIPDREIYDTDSNSSIWNTGSSQNPSTFFVDTTTPLAGLGSSEGDARVPHATLQPRTILFGSQAPGGTTLANCSVYTSYVLAEVNCNFTAPLWNIDRTSSGRTAAGACYVDRLRRDPARPQLDPYTALDANYRIAQRMFGQWPQATGIVPAGSSSPTERFINDVNTDSVTTSTNSILVATDWLGYNTSDHDNDGGVSHVDISRLDLKTFTQRFSLLFNTFWHAFCNLQAMTQTEIGLGFGAEFPPNVMMRNTTAAVSIAGQHYVIDWVWLGIYMACAILAFLAGLLALVIDYCTFAPDVLGRVSMVVKDNPFTPLPKGGSALDGHEFARKVMNMPVRFSDVRANESIGQVALVSMDMEDSEGKIAPLKRKRPYL